MLSLPKDQSSSALSVPLPDPTVHGIRLTCKDLAVHHAGVPAIFEQFNVEVTPGEKIGIYASTTAAKTALARVLAGLEMPTGGVIRYNGVDLRHIDMNAINRCRGFMIDSQRRSSKVQSKTISCWAVPIFPTVMSGGHCACRTGRGRRCPPARPQNAHPGAWENPAPTHMMRILLARAILARPQI